MNATLVRDFPRQFTNPPLLLQDISGYWPLAIGRISLSACFVASPNVYPAEGYRRQTVLSDSKSLPTLYEKKRPVNITDGILFVRI